MACEEAQELHCFGAEPAADLDADHNESTAPRALEFRVGLEALAPCSGRHCASRLHVGARVGFAASGEGGRWWRQVQAVSRANPIDPISQKN